MSAETKTYLGDGVYVELKGGMIFLSTEDGVRRTNAIYLEPEVWVSLQEWSQKFLIERWTGFVPKEEKAQ